MPAINIPKNRLIPIFPEFSPMRVKFKDVFDLKDFYENYWEWLKEHGWIDFEDRLDKFERFYGERIGTGGVKEIWIRWRPCKVPEPYGAMKDPPLRYYFDIDFHILGLSTTEIIKDGKKINTNKGEIDINIRAFVEKNYEVKFAEHGLLRHVIDIFSIRIYHRALEERKKELYRETYLMQTFLKQWFKMKTHLPYEQTESFFPSKAWPSHR